MFVVNIINDKIEEIKFDIKERVERRDDIDLIYKTFPSITLLLQDKDFIIRLIRFRYKIANAKRSRGMTFEMMRSKMTHISILGGVDANIYLSTRNILEKHDCEVKKVDLPDFATLLTPE